MTVPKNRVCLWYNNDAQDAAAFYAATFPDTQVDEIYRAPGDYPDGHEGDVLLVEFSVMGVPVAGLNGGPIFPQSEAFSFQVRTEDQAETDRYWHAIIDNGGQPSDCGWCKDKWGVSWQITPRQLSEGIADADPGVRQRVFAAMQTMKKIDIAAIEAARAG